VDDRRPTGAAFLLTQLGTHAARRFADRVSAVDLTAPQSGLIRAVAGEPGRSQQALAAQLGTPATRLVALVDALEQRGVLERRRNPDDRRLYAVHLTPAGEELLADLGRLAAAHEADLLAPLDPQERRTLAELLGRVAAAEGLTPGVHPGYRDLPADDHGPQGAPPCGT
jgi:DNA-binding MarR family transcriptional regulator